MREAEASDYWRKLDAKKLRTHLISVGYEGITGLGQGSIPFSGPITVICGGNGVGKSTLIDLALCSFSPDLPRDSPLFHTRSPHARVYTDLKVDGNLAKTTHPLGEDELVLDIKRLLLLDGARQAGKLHRTFVGDANLYATLEPYEPRDEGNEALAELSYLVNRSYTKWQTYELDDVADVIVPYFRVTADGMTYGLETMGFGELSLGLLWWNIQRAEPGSILFIDEPETHAAPRSRRAFMDLLAKHCHKRNLTAIVATHASEIVEKVSRTHVRLVHRVPDGIEVIAAPTDHNLRDAIGMKPASRFVALVEDDVAKSFATIWLKAYVPEVSQSLEIQVAGSASLIDKIVAACPPLSAVKIFGLYDGDERSKSRVKSPRLPFSFLPGDISPEEVLRVGVATKVKALADELHVSRVDLQASIASIEGQESHQWLIDLGRQMSVPIERLVESLFRVWIKSPSSKVAARLAAKQLKEALGIPYPR